MPSLTWIMETIDLSVVIAWIKFSLTLYPHMLYDPSVPEYILRIDPIKAEPFGRSASWSMISSYPDSEVKVIVFLKRFGILAFSYFCTMAIYTVQNPVAKSDSVIILPVRSPLLFKTHEVDT